MYDATDERPRYLVHYPDGRSEMRRFDALLGEGDELRDGDERYGIVHVEHPANPHSFGHAWAELVGGG
jgi:hypothetical protein